MVEKTLQKKKEPEPRQTLYDGDTQAYNEVVRQKAEGKVIIKGSEAHVEQNRQGLTKWLLHHKDWDKVGTPGWHIFINHIRVHSGKHIHQGGLALYVLSGEGYTVVDGVKYDWEEGDLVLLPIKPNGVEHQHFNKDPNRPAEWMAFIYHTIRDVISVGRTQTEEHPDWVKPPKGK